MVTQHRASVCYVHSIQRLSLAATMRTTANCALKPTSTSSYMRTQFQNALSPTSTYRKKRSTMVANEIGIDELLNTEKFNSISLTQSSFRSCARVHNCLFSLSCCYNATCRLGTTHTLTLCRTPTLYRPLSRPPTTQNLL